MFKSEVREKTVKTEEHVITVDDSIVKFCEWLYSEYNYNELIGEVITGIRNRHKQITLCEPDDEFWDDDYEELFIEYSSKESEV